MIVSRLQMILNEFISLRILFSFYSSIMIIIMIFCKGLVFDDRYFSIHSHIKNDFSSIDKKFLAYNSVLFSNNIGDYDFGQEIDKVTKFPFTRAPWPVSGARIFTTEVYFHLCIF